MVWRRAGELQGLRTRFGVQGRCLAKYEKRQTHSEKNRSMTNNLNP